MAKKSKLDKKEKKSKGGKKGKAAKDVELEEEEEDPSHDDDAVTHVVHHSDCILTATGRTLSRKRRRTRERKN